MNRKAVFWSLIIGAALGESLVVWLAPKYLIWYFTPPAPTGFDCKAPIDWALTRLQSALIWGVGIGALMGPLTLWAFRRKSPKSDLLMR
jgi:hypothetical protein